MLNKPFLDEALLEDMKIFENKDLSFYKFENKTFYVTGATGLVGSLIVFYLLYINDKKKLNMKIIAQVRNQKKAGLIFGDLLENNHLSMLVGDVRDDIHINEEIDYIFHCASITTSQNIVNYPIDTMDTLYIGTRNVLKLAGNKKVTKLIYLSSMEVYGDMGIEETRTTEEMLGFIDLLNPRSVYPEGKRACESLCSSFFVQEGVKVVIARLAQTFGAGVPKNDTRVFAQFAKSVINNEDIVLKTTGESYGNYCNSRDAMIALFTLLDIGVDGEAYNICNEDSTMKISQVAQLVADKVANNKIKVVYEPQSSNKNGFASDVKLRLSSKKMRDLGWRPEVSLLETFDKLIRSFQS